MKRPTSTRAIRGAPRTALVPVSATGDAPLPAAPVAGEIATSGEGRDITLPFLGALREVQDTVLRQLGSQNFAVYRELRRDGQVHSTFQQRRLALKSRPLIVQPGGDAPIDIEAADQLRLNLEQISFDRACGNMMWGAFYGYSAGECMWSLKEGRVWLDRVKVRTPWRFRFGWNNELRLLTQTSMLTGELMPQGKFWTTSWGADNDDDPYGLGLAHQLYWPVFFKKQGLGFWLRALEKFGAPSVVGKYPANSDKDVVNKLLAALQRLRLDGVLAMPEGTTAELLEATRGTMDQQAFNAAMNAEISKIIVGQTMTTDDGSSLSQSQTHMGIREELTDADADEICESFMAGPALWLTAWNFPGARTPILKRPAPEDEDRSAKLLGAKATAVTAMKAAGYEPTPETEASMFGDGWVKAKPPEPPKAVTPRLERVVPPLLSAPAFAEGIEPARDAIDDFTAELDWLPLLEEPIAFIESLIRESASLEEARDRLAGLYTSLPTERLRQTLSFASLEAAIAGRAGLALSVEEDQLIGGR